MVPEAREAEAPRAEATGPFRVEDDVLRASGGLTEPALAAALLGLQAAACGAGLALRFALAGRVY